MFSLVNGLVVVLRLANTPVVWSLVGTHSGRCFLSRTWAQPARIHSEYLYLKTDRNPRDKFMVYDDQDIHSEYLYLKKDRNSRDKSMVYDSPLRVFVSEDRPEFT